MPTTARRLAFRLLNEVDRGGATLADSMAARDVAELDPRERGFLHELVLGTLRHRGAIDHSLRWLMDRKLEGLDRAALTALRLGAHQLLHMRVPARAAVTESVDLARRTAPRAAGFVNAVLRRLAREGAAPAPEPDGDTLGWLTTAGSLPRWLAVRWLARLGPRASVARARACLETPPVVFRINPRRPAPEAVASLAPVALTVPGALRATAGQPGPLAESGNIYVQDEGSQLVAHLAARGPRMLDACAAPGGKATLAADVLGDGGLVAAIEISRRRAATMARLVARWGAPNVRVVSADAARAPFGPEGFDCVLLDAPCSGLGTIARHPDVRWRSRPGEIPRHAERQAALLAAVAALVRPGGRLVYSTCSSEPEENEAVVQAFLATHPAFAHADLPSWALGFADGPFGRTLPERDGGDAFFAAPLSRTA